eukprot:COSAG01_NODE_6830_length_3481_cov_4.968953_2_plen_122_part_00
MRVVPLAVQPEPAGALGEAQLEMLGSDASLVPSGGGGLIFVGLAVSCFCACIGAPCLRHGVHGDPIGDGGDGDRAAACAPPRRRHRAAGALARPVGPARRRPAAGAVARGELPHDSARRAW